MHNNEHLQFLQQKIADLRSAIFFNLSEAVLKFPTSLIKSPVVDDFGYVWAWVPKPKQNATEFENGFPVRLDFYRKGATCFLKVSGTAWIVTDPEEMYATPLAGSAGFVLQDAVLVKVKMQSAEYHETATGQKQSWWSSTVATVASLFRQPQSGYASSHTYFPAS